jgi:hypothetical protein
MYTSLQEQHASYSWLFRWCARVGGAILIVAWLVSVIFETARQDGAALTPAAYQGAALAVVFIGYVLGWRNELAGGALAILGTAAFFAVHVLAFGALPVLGAASFVVPGVLYLLAWKYNDQRQKVLPGP